MSYLTRSRLRLTVGHTDAAVGMLKEVVELKPGVSLSAIRFRQHDPPKGEPAPAPLDSIPPQGAAVAGTWTAEPTADCAITLTVQPGGGFARQAPQKGQTGRFSGASTYGDGMLTLAQDKRPAQVGRVGWKDAGHMRFRIVGDGPDDPGLSFSERAQREGSAPPRPVSLNRRELTRGTFFNGNRFDTRAAASP